MSAQKPVTIITGASAGIGIELAKIFARNGHDLVLVARRADRLAELAADIEKAGRPRPMTLALDLAAEGAADRIAEALAAKGFAAQYVVNNAGFGLRGPAANLDRREQLAMIDVNVRALTELSLAFIPSLESQRGGILNVASVAAFLPGPGMAVYYATKAYVVSFSDALHHELKGRGVRVTALCPGPVPTEFQARAGLADMRMPPLLTRSAAQVAELGYRGLMAGRRLVVPGLPNRMVTILSRLTPRRFVILASDMVQRSRARPDGRA